MKKLLAILVVIIVLVAGVIFYLPKKFESSIKSAFSASQIVQVKKNEVKSTLTQSSGELEGVITKDELVRIYQNTFINYILPLLKMNYIESYEIEEVLDEIKNSVKDDFEFRYTYSVNHPINSLGKEFSSSGIVEILTPSYASVSEKIFKTNKPIKVAISKKDGFLDTILTFSDIEAANDAATFWLNSATVSIKNSGENSELFKSAKLKIPLLAFKFDNSSIEMSGNEYIFELKDAIKKPDIMQFLTADSSQIYKTASLELKVDNDTISAKNLYQTATTTLNSGMSDTNETLNIDDIRLNLMGININLPKLEILASASFDARIYESIIKDAEVESNINEASFENVLNSLKKGLIYNIDKLTITGENSTTLDMSLNFKIDKNDGITEENFAQILDFNALLSFNSSAKKFFEPYLGVMTDGVLSTIKSEGILDENDKMRVKFDKEKVDLILNDNISLGEFFATTLEESNDENLLEKDISNIKTAMMDLLAYHTARGEFDSDFSIMTNVSINSDGRFESQFDCVRISTLKSGEILLRYGDDADSEYCQAIYQDKSIGEIFENGGVFGSDQINLLLN
ncbi:MAG: hypothetical protein MR902_05540 [Campylobacter sp.]|nr:hypothetical protein [Campylobacter sp.]